MRIRTPIRSLLCISTLTGVALLTIAGCSKPQEEAAMPAPSTSAMPAPSTSAQPSPGTAALPSITTPLGAAVDDSAVTAKVKTALLADPSIKGLAVSVETVQGDVRLSGFVESQAQIDQALKLAKAVEGVKSVHNELALKK